MRPRKAADIKSGNPNSLGSTFAGVGMGGVIVARQLPDHGVDQLLNVTGSNSVLACKSGAGIMVIFTSLIIKAMSHAYDCDGRQTVIYAPTSLATGGNVISE